MLAPRTGWGTANFGNIGNFKNVGNAWGAGRRADAAPPPPDAASLALGATALAAVILIGVRFGDWS